jgi:predicted proteasome-type protease
MDSTIRSSLSVDRPLEGALDKRSPLKLARNVNIDQDGRKLLAMRDR